ncbi:11-beta-hydroxysteroid dehydrogenase A-like isoform X1 [Euphorbia lathyris]|uniref:11-beta-hydroxysteroid dehydrogenase A-like isoform X1 n=1 Tax=Euphorbia lathyris TaxID=212925 RepID=UPI003314114F
MFGNLDNFHLCCHYRSNLFAVVNNAGISSISLLEEATDITNFRTVMDTNFWGSAYTTRFAIPYLRRSRGKIIALSSSASWLPQPRKSIYNVMFLLYNKVELGSAVDVLIVTTGFIDAITVIWEP